MVQSCTLAASKAGPVHQMTTQTGCVLFALDFVDHLSPIIN
jgi:hypothetical protein